MANCERKIETSIFIVVIGCVRKDGECNFNQESALHIYGGDLLK